MDWVERVRRQKLVREFYSNSQGKPGNVGEFHGPKISGNPDKSTCFNLIFRWAKEDSRKADKKQQREARFAARYKPYY